MRTHILLCIFKHMRKTEFTMPIDELSRLVRTMGINQDEIALATGVTQPHVSRVLSGAVSPTAKAYQRICAYVASRKNPISSHRVAQNQELVSAIASIWDGSDEQARALGAVIRSLAPLLTLYKAGDQK